VWLSTALTLVAFLLASKVVLEQYLIWPLPFLIVVAATAAAGLKTASWCLAGLLTAVGMLDNASFHPFEPGATVPWSLAAICALGLVACGREQTQKPPHARRVGRFCVCSRKKGQWIDCSWRSRSGAPASAIASASSSESCSGYTVSPAATSEAISEASHQR
jgi:hypothetical protein